MPTPTTPPSFGSFLPAISLALFSAIALGAAQMLPPKEAGDQVAVVFAPGTSLTDAVGRIAGANGAVLRAGAFSNIVVAVGSTPDFIDRLKKRGAWLVVDPRGLGGCLIATDANETGRRT